MVSLHIETTRFSSPGHKNELFSGHPTVNRSDNPLSDKIGIVAFEGLFKDLAAKQF